MSKISDTFIHKVKKHPDRFYIIHYSCQNLYDKNEGLSPRITSIAVNHFLSDQTLSFSTHAIAEELGIVREEVQAEFDRVERMLLQQFYDFVRDRRQAHWIHWNMRNLTYGFEHLEHRYRKLTGQNPPSIPIEQRINLSDMIGDRYGSRYADNPKLRSLMEMNGGVHRHFLTGEEEVEAFEKGEFIRMHNSTLAKVGFFHRVLDKFLKNRLRTKSRTFGARLDRLFESRTAKVLAVAASAIAIVFAPLQLWSFFSPNNDAAISASDKS
ncbi:hypothetical protein [Hyphomonas oceanitis]|uniref:Uncharacterized protein n=1 Tax=Hyphomonas oceanitis SCH89 TaxID=1280953 RepID=A0A059G191_9PROT|nr:hypothetical protein [Hyphomonas oceanitis]KCZ99511.1 hypothetical protein HOC_19911 [Hyphomonas oceanitis SCH89]